LREDYWIEDLILPAAQKGANFMPPQIFAFLNLVEEYEKLGPERGR